MKSARIYPDNGLFRASLNDMLEKSLTEEVKSISKGYTPIQLVKEPYLFQFSVFFLYIEERCNGFFRKYNKKKMVARIHLQNNKDTNKYRVHCYCGDSLIENQLVKFLEDISEKCPHLDNPILERCGYL